MTRKRMGVPGEMWLPPYSPELEQPVCQVYLENVQSNFGSKKNNDRSLIISDLFDLYAESNLIT